MKKFNEYISETSYQGSHQIYDDLDFNATIDDMSKNGQLVPIDFYDYLIKGHGIYGETGSKIINKEIANILLKVRNKPNSQVTIYRAVPLEAKKINRGDWVTLSKNYAKEHLDNSLSGEGKIISLVCKCSDIQWNGNSIAEMGYFPK